MVILLIYTSQVQVTHTITVNTPLLEVYSSLYEKYAETLTCPCTNIAIEQQEFISLIPTFHQICHSDFVTSNWLSYLNAVSRYLLSSDFRETGSLLFQILTSFCQLAQDAINSSLPKFYSTRFVSNHVTDIKLLNKESQSRIQLYILTTANEFAYSFDFIRDATFLNALLSGLLTNFNFGIAGYDSYLSGYRLSQMPKSYNQSYNCDCSLTASCVSSAAISDNITGDVLFVIPGLYTGCQLVEAMRQSNLECLYNQTCLNQIHNYIQSPVSFNITALNTSVFSRYNPSTTISQLLANLMVESWVQNVSYSAYYHQCQPIQCTYMKIEKNEAIYIITTSIGLFGGLYKVLYFLTPIIVEIIRRRRGKVNSIVVITIRRTT
ncbi:unnamed protein product [Rotaria sp. Silwood1]|nr:unnamed protein product [Rotaria sp. Silwood1]CAF4948814.1 unnamed protein product [Rotaria sp. Silwood1]